MGYDIQNRRVEGEESSEKFVKEGWLVKILKFGTVLICLRFLEILGDDFYVLDCWKKK